MKCFTKVISLVNTFHSKIPIHWSGYVSRHAHMQALEDFSVPPIPTGLLLSYPSQLRTVQGDNATATSRTVLSETSFKKNGSATSRPHQPDRRHLHQPGCGAFLLAAVSFPSSSPPFKGARFY
jgi:hypothetical protein